MTTKLLAPATLATLTVLAEIVTAQVIPLERPQCGGVRFAASPVPS